MKRFFVKSICLILCVGVLFYGLILAMICLPKPAAYAEHYQRGFVYQYRALERAEGRKIVTLGGSNVAYNVNTDLLGELTGIPAYNLGVNGSMGYSYILDCAKKFIGEGDIVIYPLWNFEKDDYGMELIWLTLEGESDMVFDLIASHPLKALSTIGSFGLKKTYALALGNRLDGYSETEGYSADAFDAETGNYIYERVAPTLAEPVMESIKFSCTRSTLSDWCVSAMNEFTAWCRARGAQVYFVFPTLMRASVIETDEQLRAYQSEVEAAFDAEFIMDVLDACYDYEFYFNLPTHLNSAGMDVYTAEIAQGILSAIA